MKGYSTSLATLARVYAKKHPEVSDDPTVELLIHLALAQRALERLQEMGAVLEYQNRSLVNPSLERAYHDTLWIRRNMPVEWVDTSEITRFGRFVGNAESEISDPTT